MSKKIENVAVLGSGVMGSQIAAHLTNAGYQVYLFDMNRDLCKKGIEFCEKLANEFIKKNKKNLTKYPTLVDLLYYNIKKLK